MEQPLRQAHLPRCDFRMATSGPASPAGASLSDLHLPGPSLPQGLLRGPRPPRLPSWFSSLHQAPDTDWPQQSSTRGGPEFGWGGVGGQHTSQPRGGGAGIAPPPGSCPLLPLLGRSGTFLRGAGSPGIPSCSPPGRPPPPPFPGKEEEERAAVLIKDEDTATHPQRAAQNSNVPSPGKQNSPGVNANSLPFG